MKTPSRFALSTFVLLLAATAAAAQDRPPILDMHLHALPADHQGPPPLGMCPSRAVSPAWDPATDFGEVFMRMMKDPPCDDPVWSPETDEGVLVETLEAVERFNIYGVLSGTPERVAEWMEVAPGRFYPGLLFQLDEDAPSPDSLRALHAAGRLSVLGEVTNQYLGIAPDDDRMEPYWALAEELDIPVQIHIGTGPPGVIYLGASGYRARLHSPLTLEEVLVRHPRLRVYISHAGWPMIDDLLALMYAHPQVYVDVGVIVFTRPRADFYGYLRRIVDAGFWNRVMFGSDQMVWPGVIEHAIEVIEEAPFLDEEQARAILYDNAARFLRLTDEEIAGHHDR